MVLEPALIECLVKENDCYKVWKMHYKKNILESEILLSYFGMRNVLNFFKILTIQSWVILFLLFQQETGQIYLLRLSRIAI